MNIFHKIDGVTGQDLPGAKFVLKDGDQYVKLTTSDGKDISEFKDDNDDVVPNTAKGFVDVLAKNYVITPVASDKDATTFISGDDGIFGLNGIEGSDKQYTAIETKAPDGYDPAPETPFALKDGAKANPTTENPKDATDIKDQPTSILPHTGGAGIVMYIVIGVALVVLGTIAYKKRRAN